MPPQTPPMLELEPHQVTPALRDLFNPADPASLRCFAVLDGHAAGRIFVDLPKNPTWGVLQEGAFGSLYLAGDVTRANLEQLLTSLRRNGNVLVGLWPDDPRGLLLPPDPEYSGGSLEFTTREVEHSLPSVPDGCILRRLDQSLIKEILGRNLLIHMYGSTQQALQLGHGLCLLRDGEIVSEAFAGPAANGMIEIGVETHPHHMRKGYATVTCAHLISEMERQGYRTYWNCDRGNLPSIGLARRLGYRAGKEYRLMAWFRHA